MCVCVFAIELNLNFFAKYMVVITLLVNHVYVDEIGVINGDRLRDGVGSIGK